MTKILDKYHWQGDLMTDNHNCSRVGHDIVQETRSAKEIKLNWHTKGKKKLGGE